MIKFTGYFGPLTTGIQSGDILFRQQGNGRWKMYHYNSEQWSARTAYMPKNWFIA